MDTAWNYCVVGNITKTHFDPDGTLRYGSAAFCGGTRVYLCGRNWFPEIGKIAVIGLDRHRKYSVCDVWPELIENVRLRRVYKPSVVEMMNCCEFEDGWWHDQPEEKEDALDFIKNWSKCFPETVEE